MEKIVNFFGFKMGSGDSEVGKSAVHRALMGIKAVVPHDVEINVPDSDVGNIRVASFIGEHYTSAFPFLVACRGATLHSECSVHSKRGYYESLKRTAEILEDLGAIEITMVEEEKERILFILRDSTLLEHRWITGFTARILGKNFQGMPLQYVLHPNVTSDTASGSFDALVLTGKTFFALRLVTQEPHELFFERLEALAEALDLPKARIVLPVVPQPDWRYIIERLRRRGYAACELGSVSAVLQRLRREEIQRHLKEERRAAVV